MLQSTREGLGQFWAKAFPNPRFYGWAIVGLSFLAATLSSPGQSFAISLFIEEIIATLDVSRMAVASLYGAMTLTAALCLPFVGGLADRISGRAYLTINLLLLAMAIAFFGAVQNLVMLALAFFFLRLLGQGAIGLGTLTEIVRWFRRYRGRALAVGGLGYAFGELVFPITIVTLVGLFGWRGALWSFSGVYLVVFVPLFFLLLRERRRDESMDGIPGRAKLPERSGALLETEKRDKQEELGPEEEDGEESFTLKEALRMPLFWGLLVSVAVFPMVVTAVIFHQVALFEDRQWGLEAVPLSFMCFALAGVFTSYAAGILLETRPVRAGLVVGMLLATVALLVAWGGDGSLGTSLIYGTLLGASSGILTSTNALIWPQYFGIEALGAIKGVVNGVRNGATALGPPLVALLLGPEETFGLALLVLAILSLLPALAAPLLRPPSRETS